MNDYRILFGLEGRLIKNHVLNILKNPKRLIFYLAYIVLMTWVVVSNAQRLNGTQTIEGLNVIKSYIGSGAFLLIFMMTYGITKKSSIFFKLSEINLVFTSPIDQRKILMFTLLKRIPAYLLTSVYSLVFLLSMVVKMFEPSFFEVFITGIGYTLVFLILEPLSFCLFVLSTKFKRIKENGQYMLTFLILVGIVAVIQVVKSIGIEGVSLSSVATGLSSTKLEWIPIVGWGKQLTLTVVHGFTTSTVIYLAMMGTTYLGLILLTYYLGDDYYEDVIITSEEKHEQIQSVREGKVAIRGFSLNKKNITIKDKALYASAMDWKRKLLLKKSDLSIYVSMETVLCIVIAVGVFYFAGPESKKHSVYAAAGIYFYMKFLFSMQSPLDKELKMPYYYLIPDSPMRKIIAIVKLDLVRFFINASALSLTHMIISQTFKVEYVLLPIALTLFYTLLMLSSFMFNLFVPTEDFKRLKILFKMLQMILILMPSGIVMLIIGITTESVLLSLVGSTIVNVLISTIILGLSEVLFNRLELK